jgi:GNAT superfamily N-acetyltransferase
MGGSTTVIDEFEQLEKAVLEDLHQGAPTEVAQQLGLRSFTVDGAFVSVAGALPGAIVVNRTIGLGLAAPATEDAIRDIMKAYVDAGVKRYFVHAHPDSVPRLLPHWLRTAGLEQARSWRKFERPPDPPKAFRETQLEIREVGQEHGEDFARIACPAFDLGDAAVPWLAELPGRPGWHIFMSFEGDAPVGTGALFVRDGLAWFDWGATAPAFRRRGSQGALLARRIAHARELGCRKLLTCTGEAVPGDPQHSYGNILKAGFQEGIIRDNFAPPRQSTH